MPMFSRILAAAVLLALAAVLVIAVWPQLLGLEREQISYLLRVPELVVQECGAEAHNGAHRGLGVLEPAHRHEDPFGPMVDVVAADPAFAPGRTDAPGDAIEPIGNRLPSKSR